MEVRSVLRYLPKVSQWGVLVLYLLLSQVGRGQENYVELRSEGKIPVEFRQGAVDRSVEESEAAVEESEASNDEDADEKDFIFRSNFSLDQLLQSGRVLFNDPISVYLNQVLDKILVNEPDLQGKVKVYTLKSATVNAFATDQGAIMVTLGLLERLETEAQLAFILCHELVHFREKHNIEKFAHERKIERNRGYGLFEIDEEVLSKINYSQKLEKEADSEGWKLFVKTGYRLEEAVRALTMLQYAHTPARNQAFDKKLFESADFVIPQDFVLSETAPIRPNDGSDTIEDKTDKLKTLALPEEQAASTHPALYTRINFIKAELKKIGIKSGQKHQLFLVGKEPFEKVKQLAAHEVSRVQYEFDNYEKAIYNSFTLLESSSHKKMLEMQIGQSLFMIAQYSNLSSPDYFHYSFEDQQGPAQAFFYLMEHLSAREINVIALVYNSKLKAKYPDDEHLSKLVDMLLLELLEHHYHGVKEVDAFYARLSNEIEPQGGLRELIAEEESKKGKSLTTDMEVAVNQYLSSASFRTLLESRLSDLAFTKYENEDFWIETREERKRYQRERRIHGEFSGIDKILVVDPSFTYLDLGKKKSSVTNSIIVSEKGEFNYLKLITDNSERVGLETVLLDPKLMEEGDIGKFNDMVALNHWLNRSSRNRNIDLPTRELEEVKEIMKRYGTNYLCWSGVLTMRRKREITPATIALGIYGGITVPYIIYLLASPEFRTYHYTMVLDGSTDKLITYLDEVTHAKTTRDYMNSSLYRTMYQIKNKP